MLEYGIDRKTVAILSRMYQNETSRILMNGVPTNPIIISKGVRQGASSSSICFNFIPNRLARDIAGSEEQTKDTTARE